MKSRKCLLLLLVIAALLFSWFHFRSSSTLQGYSVRQSTPDGWQLVAEPQFEVEYTEQSFQVMPHDGRIELQLTHQGGVFADLDHVNAVACGQQIELRSATAEFGRTDVLPALQTDDDEVIVAHERIIELEWEVPEACEEMVMITVVANEYGHAKPFVYDGEISGELTYEWGQSVLTPTIDGLINEGDGNLELVDQVMWRPSTGHPDGETYIYAANDEAFFYVLLDITMDNTDEAGEDFAEIFMGDESYRIDDETDTYGRCGFGMSDRVEYSHQMCEFAIPREELPSDSFEFGVRYYGTGGSPEYSNPIFPESFFDEEYAVSKFDTTVFSAAFRDTGGSETEVSGTTFLDNETFAFDIVTSLNASFIGFGEDKSSGDGYDMKVASVNSPGGAVNWTYTLTLGGDDGGPYGITKIIQMIEDGADGVFVLYMDGESFVGSGNVILVHIDNTGAATTLDTFDWYNADMIEGPSNSVYVLYEIGFDGAGVGPDLHGTVSRYTSAGKVGAFGDVAISSNTTSEKRGAVMINDTRFATGTGDAWVMWLDDDDGGASPGLYLQRIDSSGTLLEPARGTLLVNTTVGGYDAFEFLRASVGLFFDSKYVIYKDASGDWILVEIDNGGGSAGNWACTQNFGPADAVALAHGEGISSGFRGILVAALDGTDLISSLYDGDTGDTIWAREVHDSDPNLSAVMQQQFYPASNEGGTTRVDATAVLPDESNGFYIGYSKGSPPDDFFLNFDDGEFFPGPGGDCVGGAAVPDAIIDLVATAGVSEVELNWSAPADNGSAITDYIIEFREFPGGVFGVFPDGVGTSTSATVTGLTNGQEYEFRVTAVNAGGNSPVSNLETAIPQALAGGRSRTSAIGGPQFFLGKLSEFFMGDGSSQGSVSENDVLPDGLRGSGSGQDQPFGSLDPFTPGGGDRFPAVDGSFSDSTLYPEFFGGGNRAQILSLLDLVVALRKIFAWSYNPVNYELLMMYEPLAQQYHRFFRTRLFHRLVGVEYLRRGQLDAYDFDYREALSAPTDIVVFMMRSVLLTFGKSCYDEDVLRYAEEVDYPGSDFWFERYVEIMKPWMDEVLKTRSYVMWRSVEEVNMLDALYLFLYGFCLE